MDEHSMWQFVREGFEARLPLRGLRFRNSTGSVTSIDDVRLQAEVVHPQTAPSPELRFPMNWYCDELTCAATSNFLLLTGRLLAH